MPFVRIDLPDHLPETLGHAIGDVVYEAMRTTIDVPDNDRFQVITRHPPGEIVHAASYRGVEFSNDIVLIQITLSRGRGTEKKRAFYRRIVDELHRLHGVRREDVVINLVEVTPEDWSFGNGEMSYVAEAE